MTWTRGKEVIDRLIADGELERVPSDPSLVRSLLEESERHLDSAARIAETDPTGGFELCYDAMRKAAVALLAAQGLRPTSLGGHVAVRDAVAAQFGGGVSTAFRAFDRLRRVRNDLEYPDDAGPGVNAEDVASDQLTIFVP